MKKVLFFIESLAGGGAEKVLADLVSNLDRTKYEITVCTVTDGDIYQEQVEAACKYFAFLHTENYRAGGIRKIIFWLGIKFVYMLPSAFIYKLFIREKYDVEIAFVEGFSTKFIAASNNTKSKKIAWIHTNMLSNIHADSNYKSIKEHTDTYKKFQNIVCVSHSVKEAFQKKFAINKEVFVQYNPVDEMNIIERAKETFCEMADYSPILCTIGRLEEVKGYKRLVRSAKRLIEEGYLFELWIIGDGSQKEELQGYISKHNLARHVKLLGYQKNPYKYLYHSDAFICSSYEEGFSTAATESLILGKPIFTVECAGMRELFGCANCGEIVRNSEEALYEMLKRVVSQKNHIKDYHEDVTQRSSDFRLSTRIHEIDNLLSL